MLQGSSTTATIVDKQDVFRLFEMQKEYVDWQRHSYERHLRNDPAGLQTILNELSLHPITWQQFEADFESKSREEAAVIRKRITDEWAAMQAAIQGNEELWEMAIVMNDQLGSDRRT